ncbi:MAG: cytochrome d ubiquinol oxidase subunit [Actinomycetota bacterium]|jgi:cytochrome d ubiquinol oxidase subunit II
MELTTVWFGLIAVLWIGYFILEGFDFGVGMLLRVVAKNEGERRAIITTLGPLWDGNEVWLLVAGGATFAAFPEWYATLFSGFYLPLLLILVALIIRGVAFEYRSKHGDMKWRERWDLAIAVSSFIPALLWGVAFANIVRGVPLETSELGNIEYAGGFFNLLNPYALLGGLVTLTLFLTHGAIFLALKTDGPIRARSNALAGQIGLIAAVLAVAFLLWTQLAYSQKAWTWVPILAAAVMWVAGLAANRVRKEGWAFLFSATTLLLAVVSLFGVLYPNVMPNIDRLQAGLDIYNASSTDYTLKVMTIVAVVFTPIVLAYQAWTYWIFRKRLSADQIPNPESGTLGLEEVKA